MNNSGGQVPVTKTGKNPPQSTEEGVTPLVSDVPGCTLGPLFGYLPSHMKIPVQQNYLINSKIVLRDQSIVSISHQIKVSKLLAS